MQENDKTRALLMPQKMHRNNALEKEHRYRRGIYAKNGQKHPLAVTQSDLDQNPNVEFPWESRDESLQ
jgi:hypothetical protein